MANNQNGTPTNQYGTPIQFQGQTQAQAESVIDTAILVWEQMGLRTTQIMYGIAMMNVESGDIPTIPAGYILTSSGSYVLGKNTGEATSTIRGLGQFSNATWDYTAGQVDSAYGLAAGSFGYIPNHLNLRLPTNATFALDPTQTAGTNAQSGESNDPAAGQYDPQGLVEQLEVVGQGIKDEWTSAENIVDGQNTLGAANLLNLIDEGVAGNDLLNEGAADSSALLTTVALAYLAHHEGTSWWGPPAHPKNLAKTKDDLNDSKGALVSAIQSVVSAFQQEFQYLLDQPVTSSALSGLTNTTVSSADLDSVNPDLLLYGNPWQLAGADAAPSIPNDIPSIFPLPDNFVSQTTGGLNYYGVTSTGSVTSYSYTSDGSGATDVVSGSATYNYTTGTGSGVETLGNGSVVTYTESDSANTSSFSYTTTGSSGAVLSTETDNRYILNGYEELSTVVNDSSGLQYAQIDDFNISAESQVQGDYNSQSQLVEIDQSSSSTQYQPIDLSPSQPDYAEIAQYYGLPTTDPFTTSSGSQNVYMLLNAQGSDAINSTYGLTSAIANADPGFQANVALSDGSTLSWQFNPDGTISSRDLVGSDGSSSDELLNSSGQYIGTSITTSGGDGSTVTTTYNTSGAETGYSTSATYGPGAGLSINGATTTYANGYTLTAQYDAPESGESTVISSFSVTSTVENSDGTFTTTEMGYTPQYNSDGSVTDLLTGSTVTITSADQSTSTDHDASGNVTGSRVLNTNAGGSATVENFDATGTLTGSETLAMDSAGNVTLDSYGASGQLTDSQSLAVSGVLTDTVYNGGIVSGQTVSTPTAEGGNLTTYYSASGNVTGDSWIEPDGTYGSDTVQAGGGSTGVAYYTDSSWSSSVNDGQGDITTTNYGPTGTVTGTTHTVVGDSGISSDCASVDGSVQSTAVFNGDGSAQASVVESGGASVGMVLDPTDAFSWQETNSQGVTTAVSLDSDGNVAGTTVASQTDGGLVTVDYDLAGAETGYSVQTSQNGVVTTTDYAGSAGQFVETGYTQAVTGGDGTTTTTEYSVSGGAATETGYTVSTTDAAGDTTTTSYVANPDGDGTFVENGSVVVDVNLQGLVTKDEYDQSGTLTGYVTERIDSAGDTLTSQYDSAGALLQTSTVFADGVVQDVLYETDSGTVTTSWQTDGSYQQTTDDGEGDVANTNYSAAGVALSDTWTQGDGSYGSDTYNSDGSSSGTAYNSDGSYSTYTEDAEGNTLTQNYNASGALQAVEESLNDGQGDSVALTFDSSGDLTGQMWVTADGGTAAESFSTQGLDFESNLTALSGVGESLTGPAQGGIVVGWGSQESLVAGAGPTLIDGVNSDDLIEAGSGNDTLEALSAGTTLVGGSGNDLFEVDDPTDVVLAGTGIDSILSSASYTLPTNVEVLTLTGTGNLSATGNSDSGNLITGSSGNDTLIAGSGSDTLVSGSGVDTLMGGSGPDTFIVNNSADVVDPLSYEGGRDTIESSVSYVLTAPVSTLQLTGSGDLSATDDYGYASITGNAGEDTLTGGSGNDTLIAGTGVDTLIAGSGNTLFVVDNAPDVVQVTGQAGSDTVESSVSYTLGQGLDTLELTGSSDLEGQGNADAANLIDANSGDDTLVAGSGSDTLVAGSATDTLVAGSGTDVLEGRGGSTTYVFDSGFGQAEVEPGSGSGTIEFGSGITASDLAVGMTTDSSGNPALLIQDGSGSVTVDGGLAGTIGSFDFADGTQLTLGGLLTAATATPGSLAGANGNAVLNTSAAASLSGGYGNDTILGTGASDTLTAGSGSQYLLGAGDGDSITGAFGNDTLVGDGANDTLVAGNGAQELYGLGTGDVLIGGMGDDTLYGGTGNDTFVSGMGGTVIYGGNAGDSLVLTEGADVTFYPSSTSGVEFIQLPNQMTLADFTSYEGVGGDLILQSLSGDTTAVIEGFYSSTNQKTWLITDSTGTTQSLAEWASSNRQPPSDYQAQIEGLQQACAADLPAVLNQVGQQGGTIMYPGSVFTQTPQDQYQFDGVTTENVAVQGGVLNLGSSEDIQGTYTTLQTGSTTYTEATPHYSEVTIPGGRSFITYSSLDSLDQSNMQNEVGGSGGAGSVTEGTDANGDPGYWVTMLPYTEEVATGPQTIVETVPTYTTYTHTTEAFVDYNVTGDGANDVINAAGPFVGTVVTGNGNVSLDLGMQNGGVDYYYPNEPALGAFIDAGSGNDSIIGSGGPDTIAAGTGCDYIEAGLGSTVYVPLQGTSTEDIDIEPPFYGFGPLPRSTLVLPNGITPEDLQYRLVSYGPSPNDSDGQAEALQITYGDSSVLIDFIAGPPPNAGDIQNVPSDDWNGIDQFQFSGGTVLTREQILAMAGAAISASDLNPTVTALKPTVYAGSSIAGDALFSGTDSSGSQITWYQISNSGAGGAYFTLNGAEQTPEQTFFVNSEQLSQLEYVAGTGGSTDAIQVSAFDGLVWGNTTSFNVSPSASLYEATGANQEVTGGSSGPDTLVGGYGGDTLVGSSGQDTFEYNAGGGAESISETAPVTSTSDNVLEFGSGITPPTLTLAAAAGSELVLSTGASGDSVSIEGFNPLDPLQSFPIQSFAFPDATDLTALQLLSDSAVTGTSGSITNPDGTTTDYQFTPSSGQIYSAQTVSSTGHWLETVSVNADGSDTTSSYTYNADGSETETDVLTPSGGGGSTTKVLGINSEGQITSVDVTNPDGSTDNSTYTYNPDGSQVQTEVETPAGGGAPTTIVYDINSQWQTMAMDITNPDGSTSDRTYVYNADGSQTETDVETPAGGGGATTTVYDINSQGQRTSVDITNPDGSTDDSSYVFNTDGSVTQTEVGTPAGGGGSTTTVYQINSQNRWTSKDVINPDGSTDDTTYTYNADGSQTDTEVQTPAGGGTVTTIVANYSADGTLLNDNSYALSSDGSYTDNWNNDVNGSHGSYWWNASSSEYQESWYDSNGSSWTDQYQYASGGSPATTGYSFTETYEASDGSEGGRQYDALTGAVTLSWDSASTGQLNGTTTDSGFYGLEDESELTNTRPDLTFFNPSASPNFNAFLNAH